MEKRFGLFMEAMLCKVTNEPRQFQNMSKIPCSIGFKNKEGFWTNVWIDVLVTNTTDWNGVLPTKGASVKVWGRVDCSTWKRNDGTEEQQWSVWADIVETQGAANNYTQQPQREPFAGGDPNNVDSVPF